MKGTTAVILLGVGGSIGFVAGNVFIATKVIESETLRHALTDIIAEKISKTIFGETKNKRPTKVSYSDYYRTYRSPRYTNKPPVYKYVAETFIFDTRGDAEKFLSDMEEIINTYGCVSVTDYYELVGFNSKSFTESKFGWTTLKSATVFRVNGGYTIKLPLAISLK